MSYEELLEVVKNYFGDTSRSAEETRKDLSTLASECEMMAESIQVDEA